MSPQNSITTPAPTVPKNSLISVIDDDQSMGRMLSRMILTVGLDVEVFTSAEEFLDSDRLRDPICLVLDVDLPGMSGLDLQQRLHNSDRRIPIIFISGQASEQTRERALEAGALGFFNKPFSVSSLLSIIRSINGLPMAKPIA